MIDGGLLISADVGLSKNRCIRRVRNVLFSFPRCVFLYATVGWSIIASHSCVPIPVVLVFYCVKPEPQPRVGQGNTIKVYLQH